MNAALGPVRRMLPSGVRNTLRRAYDSLYCRNLPGKMLLGSVDHWTVYTRCLYRDSVVYSGGVGKDITFEHALASSVGCVVHLFDPSDTGRATMAKPENRSSNICFYPLGLAGESGEVSFSEPLDPLEGSFFQGRRSDARSVRFVCESVSDAMARLGHTSIDLLKLDIEGSEYGVIDEIHRRRIDVRQLCVEMHPRMYGDKTREHDRARRQLAELGYLLIHRERNDYTFLLRSVSASGG